MKTNSHTSRKSLASRHRGVSNAHAFAVGKATGVRLNGGHAANTGAALHNAKKHRENARKHFKTTTKTGSHTNLFKSTSNSTVDPSEIKIPELNVESPINTKFVLLLLIPIAIFILIITIVMFVSFFKFLK